MLQLVISVLLVLLFSALASGTEAALFAVPYGKVMNAADQGRRGGAALLQIKDDFRRPIQTIVIINNLSNILGSIAVGSLASGFFDTRFMGLFSGCLTFLVIVYAEIIPKTLGERYCEPVALAVAGPILALSRLVTPVHLSIELLVRPFAGEATAATASEEEIMALTKLGQQQGEIDQDENTLIQKVFNLDDIVAREIMTPISRADTVEADAQIGELVEWVQTLTHSRIPVYRDSIDNIVGIVHTRDLMLAFANDQMDAVIVDFKQDATFVPMSMTAIALINHLRREKAHLAIVVNAEGTVLGLVTLEDAIEELVGEIEDENDPLVTAAIERISEHELLVDADVELEDLQQFWNVHREAGCLAELIISHLGRIPQTGESIRFDAFEAVIVEATPRRITKVRLLRNPDDSSVG